MISIAVDGPSGAGKSTVAKKLAEKLGIAYLDTGAMYRALGLKVQRTGVSAGDEKAVCRLLDSTVVSVEYDGFRQKTLLDGEDVTEKIREHAISKIASDISAIPAVRKKMAELQRKIASEKDCVLDGREIGSYVLPDARYKFFLTASPEVRAERRRRELAAKGSGLPFEKVLSDILTRDQNDTNRAFAPLVCVPDAVVVDSSFLTADEVVEKFLEVIGEKNNG